MKSRTSLILLCCCLILGILSGCVDPHRALYGKWEAQATSDLKALGLGTLIFDFQQDGNLRITISAVTVDIQYEFVNADTIRFKGTGAIASILAGQEVTYKISGDTLELISNNQAQKFTRVNGQ